MSSLMEGYERVNILPPFLRNFADMNFDSDYAQYLIQNDMAFFEMFKIVLSLYMGYNVTIMVSHDGYIFDVLTESFQRFIRFRYGILSYNVNCNDDYSDISNVGPQFTVLGVQGLDLDKDRYLHMYATIYPQSLKNEDE